MRRINPSFVLAACLGLLLGGCELIVDFDRSQIEPPGGPDAGPDAAVGTDAQVDSGNPSGDAATADGG